jgi:cytochrome c556
MLKKSLFVIAVAAAAASSPPPASAESPQEARHELMEEVGQAAKAIGKMLRGEADYDWAVAQESLTTFTEVAGQFGDLFPEGSDTGDTEAAPSIWEDRDGFNAALQDWADATAAARDAAPATLEDAKPVLGPVFNTCKNCHDNYRIDDD